MGEIHIGYLIKQKMKELHINNTAMAKKIDLTRQNIGSIVKRKSINTDLLRTISEGLGYDFFQHYTLVKKVDLEKKIEELLAEKADIYKQLEDSRKEVAHCERIIKLLSGKNS